MRATLTLSELGLRPGVGYGQILSIHIGGFSSELPSAFTFHQNLRNTLFSASSLDDSDEEPVDGMDTDHIIDLDNSDDD